MHINTFWKIIIKSIGLWLLVNCVWVIPQFTSTLNIIDHNVDWYSIFLIWTLCFFTLIVYILVTRLFLFKTEWIIRLLKLDQNFIEDRIGLEFPAKSILTIIVVLIGGIMFIYSLPDLAASIFEFLQQKELIKDYNETGWMIYNFFAALFGLLLMSNGKFISNYIWKNNTEN